MRACVCIIMLFPAVLGSGSNLRVSFLGYGSWCNSYESGVVRQLVGSSFSVLS